MFILRWKTWMPLLIFYRFMEMSYWKPDFCRKSGGGVKNVYSYTQCFLFCLSLFTRDKLFVSFERRRWFNIVYSDNDTKYLILLVWNFYKKIGSYWNWFNMELYSWGESTGNISVYAKDKIYRDNISYIKLYWFGFWKFCLAWR